MAEIIKVYKEHLPALRFIGKRYTEEDRLNGGFGHKWGEWFQNGWFNQLEKLGEMKAVENGYLGFMRGYPHFEYWIGMFLPASTPVPEGYEDIDLNESDVGICWIKGREDDGSIYSMHEQCVDRFNKEDLSQNCFFERYNCPRFTQKDEKGDVILDYGIYLV